MTPRVVTKQKAVLGALTVMVLGAITAYGLQYRRAVSGLTTSMEALAAPDWQALSAGEFSETLGALSALPGDLARAEELERDRSSLVNGSNWLQRRFAMAPGPEWIESYRGDLTALAEHLPGVVEDWAAKLSNDLLSNPGAGDAAREAAALFRANRDALGVVATELDDFLLELGVSTPGVARAFNADDTGRVVVEWIDRTADVEARALELAQDAMVSAQRAERVTRALQPDAPAREIREAVLAWSDASSEARAAVRELDRAPSDPRAEALVAELTASARSQTERAAGEIESSLRNVTRAYESAQAEEATLLGALSRFGRRAARRVREFAVASAPQLEQLSGDLSAALNSGLTQAAMASGDIVSEGMRAYEESRKPPVQRYIESSEGMATIGIGFFMLLSLVMALGVALRSAASPQPSPGRQSTDETPSGSDSHTAN